MPGLIFGLIRHPIRVIERFMNDNEKLNLKEKLKNYCLDLLRQRLATAESLVQTAQESANNEGKSSAGDKYETGRAMGHLQKEMYQQQSAKIRHELLVASSTEVKLQPATIKRGTVIVSDNLIIFICVGLGKKSVDGHTVLFVSEDSPLFTILARKRHLETFQIDKSEKVIREIW